ncbi:MAG: hypothetical protein GY941_21045 [Planctomycetes bacterium]|nr:hypothetical protein [Planctomycetota bacterium]
MRILKSEINLDCGCCGGFFETWEGYIDQDQDSGYGICRDCQGFIDEKETEERQKLIDCVRDNLSEEKRKTFEGFAWDKQYAIARMALDKGIIKYTFKSA